MVMALDCKAGKVPFIYLGMPVGARMDLDTNWKPLLEKFSKRLNAWKLKSMSIGRRFTLCKSVLGGLGICLFSFFKVPSKVLKLLERSRKDFFGVQRKIKLRLHGSLAKKFLKIGTMEV